MSRRCKPRLEHGMRGIEYIDAKGRRFSLEAVLTKRYYQEIAREAHKAATLKNVWWRLNRRSRDAPGSKAARADISDGGSGAAAIYRHADGGNYYRRRIRLAAEYLAGRSRQSADEIARFLMAVHRNGARHRRETMAEMGITRQWYYVILNRFIAAMEDLQWCRYRKSSEKLSTVFEKS